MNHNGIRLLGYISRHSKLAYFELDILQIPLSRDTQSGPDWSHTTHSKLTSLATFSNHYVSTSQLTRLMGDLAIDTGIKQSTVGTSPRYAKA